MNTPRVRLSVKLMVTEFSDLHEEKVSKYIVQI